jgi:hypothetical protein
MGVTLIDLWLPIVVTAVVVFFASFITHMVLKHHKSDWDQLPDEDGFMAGLRASGAKAGSYMFPHCDDHKKMYEPEMKKKLDAGPIGTIVIWPGAANMGSNLIRTFILYVVIAVCVAYLATVALPAGSEFIAVFRFTATAAVMAHCLGFVGHAIWYMQKRSAYINDTIDGIAYGLLTGVIFGLLWPAADSGVPLPSIG